MSLIQLFLVNFKILFRNWRGLFWNLVLPIGLYVGLALLRLPGLGITGDYASYLLPGMVAMTIMQTGIFTLAYWLIELRERGVIKRLQVTPMSGGELVTSLILSRLVLMLVQITIIVLIGIFFFGVRIQGSFIAILLFSLLGGTFFLCLGFFISTIAHSYDEASPITTLINLIFTFTGNVFFPTAVFPTFIKTIAAKFPLTYLADGLRQNFTTNATFSSTWYDFYPLLIWLAIIFTITSFTFRNSLNS